MQDHGAEGNGTQDLLRRSTRRIRWQYGVSPANRSHRRWDGKRCTKEKVVISEGFEVNTNYRTPLVKLDTTSCCGSPEVSWAVFKIKSKPESTVAMLNN